MAAISESVVYFHMDSVDFPLESPPRIVQAGLSLHGYRRREAFTMHGLWGIHLYLYPGSLKIESTELPFANGHISITPADVMLEWFFPDHAPHYYAHIEISPKEATRNVPIILGPVQWLEEAVSAFEYVGAYYQSEPVAASSRLWSILWRAYTDSCGRTAGRHHLRSVPSTVQIAISIIDQSLSEKIRVSYLAHRVGVSHNHLISLFRKTFGTTVTAYIRKRRCARARFLLGNTSLTVKSIAREVGIPDLHHFNKTIRLEYGYSPRALRGKLVQDQSTDFRGTKNP